MTDETTKETRTKVSIHELAWSDAADLGEFLDTMRQIHDTRTVSIWTVGMKMYGLFEQEIDVEEERKGQQRRREVDQEQPRLDITLKLRRSDGEPVDLDRIVKAVERELTELEVFATDGGSDRGGGQYAVDGITVLGRKRIKGQS